MNPIAISAAVIALLAFGCVPAKADPPQPSNYTSIGDYTRALNSSNDPAAITLRTAISNGPADLARAETVAKGEGIPLTADTTMPQADKNAATIYKEWRALQRERNYSSPNYASVMTYGWAYTPAQLEAIRQLIKAHLPEFDLLRRAIGQPAWAYPLGVSPDYASVREAAREIEMESYMLANDGQYKQAVATQALGFKIAKQIQYRLGLVSYDVGEAVMSISLVGFRSILYLAGPNAGVDQLVIRTIRADDPHLSLHKALVSEIGVEVGTYDAVRVGTADAMGDFVQETLYQHSPDSFYSPTPWRQTHIDPEERVFVDDLLDATEGEYMATLLKCMSATSDGPAARRTVFAAAGGLAANAANLQPYYTLFMLGGSGLVPGVDVQSDSADAGEQVVLAAAAILADKAKTGALPTVLPSGFVDPFIGKQLGYRREGSNGFVVYSVGKDGKFSGGKTGSAVKWPDIGFRYPATNRVPLPLELQ
jgi:hypothetical protein